MNEDSYSELQKSVDDCHLQIMKLKSEMKARIVELEAHFDWLTVVLKLSSRAAKASPAGK